MANTLNSGKTNDAYDALQPRASGKPITRPMSTGASSKNEVSGIEIYPEMTTWGKTKVRFPKLNNLEVIYNTGTGREASILFQYLVYINNLRDRDTIPGYLPLILPSISAFIKFKKSYEAEMKMMEKISGGMIPDYSHNLLVFSLKYIADPFWKAQYLIAQLGGIVTGAVLSVRDLIFSIPDLIEFIYSIISDFEALLGINWSQLWEQIVNEAGQYLGKLVSPNPWEAGFESGKILGYILLEIILALLTAGTTVGAKVTLKLGTYTRKVVDTGKRISKFEQKLVKNPKLIAKITAIKNKAGSKKIEQVTKALIEGPIPTKKIRKHNQEFMNSMLKISKDKDHPLYFLVDPSTGKWKQRVHGQPEGIGVQAGHLESFHAGAEKELLALEDADFNQWSNWKGERQGSIFLKQALDIGGVPVEYRTAFFWASIWDEKKKIGLNPELLEKILREKKFHSGWASN